MGPQMRGLLVQVGGVGHQHTMIEHLSGVKKWTERRQLLGQRVTKDMLNKTHRYAADEPAYAVATAL